MIKHRRLMLRHQGIFWALQTSAKLPLGLRCAIVNSVVQSFTHVYVPSFVDTVVYFGSFVISPVRFSIHSFVRPFFHSFFRSLAYSPIC